ncbi:hypothetical protein DFH09DRAFT_1073200 [Mycena vulgaris]|nr:hypothetical protein DFH09DRAFT_1073200 [Mycena vulgaris]
MDLHHILNSGPEPLPELLVDVGPQILALHSLLASTQSLGAPQHVQEDLGRILALLQALSRATAQAPSISSSSTLSQGSQSSSSEHPLATNILSHVRITSKTTLSELYQYPINTDLEYPETSEMGVGHLFQLQPGTVWGNPTSSFAYSLGSPKGYSLPGREVDVDFFGNGFNTESKDHLVFTAIADGSYDMGYLDALFGNDTDEIKLIEDAAFTLGFGPLVECSTVCNISVQKTLCPFDHRDAQDILIQHQMICLECMDRKGGYRRVFLKIENNDFIQDAGHLLVSQVFVKSFYFKCR